MVAYLRLEASLRAMAEDTGVKFGPAPSPSDLAWVLWVISRPFESTQNFLFISKPSRSFQATVVNSEAYEPAALELCCASTANSRNSAKKSENLTLMTPNYFLFAS